MSKAESADLILKLYELRREPTMREARSWIISFFPESTQDIMQAIVNAQTSAYYRMVTSYWDMAAAFVNHGAIDEEMFSDTNGEFWVVFAKIQPFLPELREIMGSPKFMSNLEKLVMRQPDAQEKLEATRERMKRWMQARNNSSSSEMPKTNA